MAPERAWSYASLVPRVAEGWKLRLPAGHSTYNVRFRHRGRRYDRGTGESDPAKAAVEAARIYGEIVTGRKAARPVASTLAEAAAAFLEAYEVDHAPGTSETVRIYFKAQFLPFFGSFENFTDASYSDFVRDRIARTTRVTVRKELSALRLFVAWCNQRGIALPPVPSVPKHGHAGKRAKNARKRVATIMTPGEVRQLLAAMPERSSRTGAWVRPLFAVLYETGLRPSTVLRLTVPEHYAKGKERLFISREIDKEGFERHVPLSPAGRKALDQCVERLGERGGRLFDAKESSLRFSLEAAVRKCKLQDRNISVYDFKHTRLSIDANSGAPLAGVAHLAGHKSIATTAKYIQTGEAAAAEVMAVRQGRGKRESREPAAKARPRPKRRKETARVPAAS